jgi:hypothetical protein
MATIVQGPQSGDRRRIAFRSCSMRPFASRIARPAAALVLSLACVAPLAADDPKAPPANPPAGRPTGSGTGDGKPADRAPKADGDKGKGRNRDDVRAREAASRAGSADGFLRAARELPSLTTDQRKQIEAFFDRYESSMREFQTKHGPRIKELSDLRREQTKDGGKADEALNRELRDINAKRPRLEDVRTQVETVLTDAQKKEVADIIAKQEAARRERATKQSEDRKKERGQGRGTSGDAPSRERPGSGGGGGTDNGTGGGR